MCRSDLPWFTVVVFLLAISSIGSLNASELVVEASPAGLSIQGATADGVVFVAGVGRRLDGYVTTVRTGGGRLEASLDGLATLEVPWLEGGSRGVASAWAVVDVTTGSIAVLETGTRNRQFSRIEQAVADEVILVGRRKWVLVVRPGVDVWGLAVADGGPDDSDRRQDGLVAFSPTAFAGLGDRTIPLDELAAGDIVIALDYDDLSVSALDVVEGLVDGETPKTSRN